MKRYEESYLKTYRSKVKELVRDHGKSYLILDETIFYPLGGGQEPDRGTIDGIEVLNVFERDGMIYHEINSESFSQGQEVQLSIDWKRRYDFMVQHTGEHILTGIITQDYGLENVGFHIGEHSMRIDYNGLISDDELKRSIYKANAVVRGNLPVRAYYPSDDELSETSYRFKKEILDGIRLVEIPGVDSCACCGTHVQSTAEVGAILVASRENYKGGLRLNVLCGDRALDFHYQLIEDAERISQAMSAPLGNSAPAVLKKQQEYQDLRKKYGTLEAEVVRMQAEKIEDTENVILCVDYSQRAVEDLASLLKKRITGILAILREEEGQTNYLLMSSSQDMKSFSKEMNEALDGRGGGKPERAQGKLQRPIKDVLAYLETRIN